MILGTMQAGGLFATRPLTPHKKPHWYTQARSRQGDARAIQHSRQHGESRGDHRGHGGASVASGGCDAICNRGLSSL